jgi:thioredoxin 1
MTPTTNSVTTTTDVDFAADVLASPTPVLLEFSAEWCGPCTMLAPVLEKIAAEQADRLRVVKIDVDTSPETSRRYNVLGMPTLALFVRGELVARILGARSGRAILQEFEPHLAAA